MGHKYVKEDEVFTTSRNGVVPKPTQQEVSDGKVLKADGSWGAGGGGGASALGDLSDVDTTGASNGDVLTYDGQEWKPQEPSGGTVTDVEVDGQSVVNPQTGVAEITMPSPPTIPVTDVKVNNQSVVDGNKIAQIKSYKEVTQAQYEALPDTKLTDNIMYMITDIPDGTEGYPPLIYSLDEREVGVYVDGKPLYEKTFYYSSLPSSGECIFQTNIVVDKVASIKAICKWYEYAFVLPFVSWDNGLSVEVTFNTQTNDIRIHPVNSSFYQNASDFYITVRYTKPTDTVGSGTWGENGALAHHYSTQEKIVGTWIDGKPLYERTFVKNFSSATSVLLDSSGIEYAQQVASSYMSSNVIDTPFYLLQNTYVYCYTDVRNGEMQLYNNYNGNIQWTVTIQYTKTTD